MKTTVIHHSADYDGIFCREIARKFLPDAELIGWDFADKPVPVPEGQIYVLDLPVDRIFGFDFNNPLSVLKIEDQLQGDDIPHKIKNLNERLFWIDHHASSIASHPKDIPGYRIDGVAACRLAWQWFRNIEFKKDEDDASKWPNLPTDVQFKNREVDEPLAVRLAGEYDVWDHRGDGDLEFQFGLDTEIDKNELMFKWLLEPNADIYVRQIVAQGKCALECYRRRDAEILRARSFLVDFEGLKFLALNTARCNSNTFAARDIPETGHDALMGFFFNGSKWTVSLYHAAHRKDIDLSQIAVKHGGGGHKGACGFTCSQLPFVNGATESPSRFSEDA